jgi:hypothetical protein
MIDFPLDVCTRQAQAPCHDAPALNRPGQPSAPPCALVSSVIFRHAAAPAATPHVPGVVQPLPTPLVNTLIARCQEVEGRAFRRVVELASCPVRVPRRPATSGGSDTHPMKCGGPDARPATTSSLSCSYTGRSPASAFHPVRLGPVVIRRWAARGRARCGLGRG